VQVSSAVTNSGLGELWLEHESSVIRRSYSMRDCPEEIG